MANKGKKIARRTPQELLQAQQLAFAKTVLKANGYTFQKGTKSTKEDGENKDGKKSGKNKFEFTTVPALFKHIRKQLKLAEGLLTYRLKSFSEKNPEEDMSKIVDEVANELGLK